MRVEGFILPLMGQGGEEAICNGQHFHTACVSHLPAHNASHPHLQSTPYFHTSQLCIRWSEHELRPFDEVIIYELHVGSFTPEVWG